MTIHTDVGNHFIQPLMEHLKEKRPAVPWGHFSPLNASTVPLALRWWPARPLALVPGLLLLQISFGRGTPLLRFSQLLSSPAGASHGSNPLLSHSSLSRMTTS